MHDGIGHMVQPSLGRHPPRQTPQVDHTPRTDTPWAYTSPGQTPPPDMVNEQAVCILLECILVLKREDLFVLPKWRQSFMEFSRFNESYESLKHDELGSM